MVYTHSREQLVFCLYATYIDRLLVQPWGQVWFTRSLVKHAQRHTSARGPHLGASVKGAQDGTCAKRDQSICSSWACSGRDLWHSVDVRHSCRQSPHFHQLRCTLAWHIWSQDNMMNRYAAPLPSVYNPLIHPTNPAKWLGIDDIFTLPYSSFYPWILGTDSLCVLVTVFDSPRIRFIISHLRPFILRLLFPHPVCFPLPWAYISWPAVFCNHYHWWGFGYKHLMLLHPNCDQLELSRE